MIKIKIPFINFKKFHTVYIAIQKRNNTWGLEIWYTHSKDKVENSTGILFSTFLLMSRTKGRYMNILKNILIKLITKKFVNHTGIKIRFNKKIKYKRVSVETGIYHHGGKEWRSYCVWLHWNEDCKEFEYDNINDALVDFHIGLKLIKENNDEEKNNKKNSKEKDSKEKAGNTAGS